MSGNGEERKQFAPYHALATEQGEPAIAASRLFVVEGENPLIAIRWSILHLVSRTLAVGCREDKGAKVFVGIIEKVAGTEAGALFADYVHLYYSGLFGLPLGTLFTIDIDLAKFVRSLVAMESSGVG